MKNRFISFLLALVLICQLFTATIPITVNATSQSNYPPYASIEYEYSSSVTCGTIRYIRQSVNKTYFYWDYWPSSAFGNYSGPGNECGTACISMALSYIGINKTPYDILKKYNGSTVFDGGWGATYTASGDKLLSTVFHHNAVFLVSVNSRPEKKHIGHRSFLNR